MIDAAVTVDVTIASKSTQLFKTKSISHLCGFWGQFLQSVPALPASPNLAIDPKFSNVFNVIVTQDHVLIELLPFRFLGRSNERFDRQPGNFLFGFKVSVNDVALLNLNVQIKLVGMFDKRRSFESFSPASLNGFKVCPFVFSDSLPVDSSGVSPVDPAVDSSDLDHATMERVSFFSHLRHCHCSHADRRRLIHVSQTLSELWQGQ